jgi:MoaA/NifB/PqqE/SkfB family radical SAM enzyme
MRKVGHIINNTLNGTRNLLFRKINKPLKPKWIVFMPTDKCNSRCIHCNIWKNKSVEKNPLTPEEIGKIFSDDLFEEVEYVMCTGGEVTLREDLEEIFLRLQKALPKARLQLSTNGLLPERVTKVVNTAMKNNIYFSVGVSLDGIGEDHDRIRGIKGNFEKVDRLIHELVKMRKIHKERLNISAGIVLSDLTLNSLSEVRSYTNKLNINLEEQWYNQSSFYDNIEKNIITNQLINAIKSQPISPLQDNWLKLLNGNSIKFTCFAMNTFCILKCNGDIVPCLNLFNIKAGNVREKSATEIWHSYEMKKVRNIVANCKGCLNSWGVGWSFVSSYYPILQFYLKHPHIIIEKLNEK